ncbi:MAG: hypothetical protein AB8B69_26765 [Chitinophagales bacterium]
MKKSILLTSLFVLLFSACIKDDFIMDTVDSVLRITSTVDTIALESSFQFEFMYLNNVGQSEAVNAEWQSSNPDIISINNSGLAQGLQIGTSTISVEYSDGNNLLKDSMEVNVGENTTISTSTKMGSIATTSTYKLTGDFTISEDGDDLLITFDSNYEASTALPGLYVYLTNNPNTTANAFEIGAVQIFSGMHEYRISGVNINDYSHLLYFCKPFTVKVGDGEIL